jgi:16S rRNA processing protein RimM
MPSNLVTIGRVLKPHGINGELLVEYYAESPDLLDKPLLMRAGRFAPRPVRLREWHLWRDQLIISLDGCAGRSEAEHLRGQEILIEAAYLPPAEEDEPYLRDLVGLEVRLPSGETVGTLQDILDISGQEVWSISAPDDQGGYEILFPAMPQFVISLHVGGGLVVIDPPEGLLELYREEGALPSEAGAEDRR